MLWRCPVLSLVLILGCTASAERDSDDSLDSAITDGESDSESPLDARSEGEPLDESPPQCPTFLLGNVISYPLRCNTASLPIPATGVECRYPAIACPPGAKPDNVCRCHPNGEMTCEGHIRTCLPFSDEAQSVSPVARPVPRHRPSSVDCQAPTGDPGDCVPVNNNPGIFGSPTSTCKAQEDCGEDKLCLQSKGIMQSTECHCRAIECLADIDCGEGMACDCGLIDPATTCEAGYYSAACSHRCVPAECRVDADCGPGGLCSPVFDDCLMKPTRFACHRPEQDECMSDAECVYSSQGTICRFDAGRWNCASRYICD